MHASSPQNEQQVVSRFVPICGCGEEMHAWISQTLRGNVCTSLALVVRASLVQRIRVRRRPGTRDGEEHRTRHSGKRGWAADSQCERVV